MTQKTYAITGCSNGIGRALADLLRQEGHSVIGLDIAQPSAALDHFISLDLSDPHSINNAANELKQLRGGQLHGLCNSAGLPPREGLEQKILEVNFQGTVALTNDCLSVFVEGASVVNLASRAGQFWQNNLDQVKRFQTSCAQDAIADFIDRENIDPVRAYDLSKEAIITWTIANSEILANRGLRINSISPGAVQTDIIDDFEAAFGERMIKNVARAGRAGQAEEIAHLAAYLLSARSSWIKGSDIGIDGGMLAFNLTDKLDLGQFIAN